MDRRFLIAALVLCAVGCKPEKDVELSPEQVTRIRADVTAATDTIVARFSRLDVDGTFAVYHESPDFVVLGPDGSKVGYAAYRKMNADFVAQAASVMITTKANDCRVMASDLTICAWTGREEVVLKTGDTQVFDPFAVTLVFKNYDGQWKVTYSHESATLTTKPAAKK